MAQRANLIATYNANPTLQKQYTLPQYLALFDFGQTPTTPTSTPTPTPTPATPGIPNIINQNINQGGGGGNGGGGPPPGPTDPYAGLGYSSANFGLGKETIGDFVNKDAVMDYEADAYNIGRTVPGQLSKFGLAAFNAFKNLPTPLNLVRKGLEFAKQNALQKEKEKEAQLAAITRDIARSNKAAGTGGYQAGYGGDFMGGAGRGTGMGAADKGGSDSMGSFQDGGRVYLYNRLK
jgi:hypothetical protein